MAYGPDQEQQRDFQMSDCCSFFASEGRESGNSAYKVLNIGYDRGNMKKGKRRKVLLMKKRRKKGNPVSFLVLMCLISILILIPERVRGEEKYMKGEQVDFSVQLDEHGNAQIKEVWKCFFGGDTITRYSRRFQLPENGYTIEIQQILMDGQEMMRLDQPDEKRPEGSVAVYEEEDSLHLDMYLKALEESHEFTFEYLVKDAVILHQDIAEFRWVLISDKEAFAVENVTGEVFMPQAVRGENFYFWGHGPEEAVFPPVQSQEETVDQVSFHVPAVQKGNRVSFRLAMPLELFPLGGRKEAGAALEEIQGEEERGEGFAQDEEKDEADKFLAFVLVFGFFGVLLIKPLSWLAAKYGNGVYTTRKLKKLRNLPQGVPSHVSMPPDDMKPAMVYKLLSLYPEDRKIVGKKGNVLAAVFTDLMNRGIVEYRQENNEIFLRVAQGEALTEQEQTMTDYEKAALEMVAGAGTGSFVTMKQVEKYLKKNRSLAKIFHDRIKKSVDEEFDAFGILEETPEPKTSVAKYVVGILIFVTGLMLGMHMHRGILMSLILGLLIMEVSMELYTKVKKALCPQIRYFTQEGEKKHAMWQAYARFLEQMICSREEGSYGPEAWRTAVPYAVALGRGKNLAKQMEISVFRKQQVSNKDPYLQSVCQLMPCCPNIERMAGYHAFVGWRSDHFPREDASSGSYDGGYDSGSDGSSFD